MKQNWYFRIFVIFQISIDYYSNDKVKGHTRLGSKFKNPNGNITKF